MKIDVNCLEYFWPMRHYLITSGDIKGKSNVMTVSFCFPVSKEPPMIAMAIGKLCYSLELIRENKQFAVNVPAIDIKSQVYFCGYNSGRKVDKFKETGLTAVPAKKIISPVIEECPAHMECLVINEVGTGDKILIIAEVISAYADEEIVNGIKKLDFELGQFPKHVYGK